MYPLSYGRPMNRFPALFGDSPETTIVPDRLWNAIAAATRFEGVSKQVSDCQHNHYLLRVIQREVLRDAAELAFTRQVDVLKEDHEKRVIPALQAAYQERMAEIEPDLVPWRTLESDCTAAVSEAFRVEGEADRQDRQEHLRILHDLELRLATATTFAAESKLPMSDEDAQLADRIVQLKSEYDQRRNARVTERERVSRELKRQCEDAKRPIWASYRSRQEEAKRAFDETIRHAQRELRAKIDALRQKFEQAFVEAERRLNAQYAYLTGAEEALQAAIAAYATQMKEAREKSAQTVSSDITTLFAIRASEVQDVTVEAEAERAVPRDPLWPSGE